MLSLCSSHVTIMASPFRSSVFHFLAINFLKFVRFSSHMKRKTLRLSLLHKKVNISSHRKGNLVALTTVDQLEVWLKVRDMPSKLSLPRPVPWNLVWVKQLFDLSEVELSEFHCIMLIEWIDCHVSKYMTNGLSLSARTHYYAMSKASSLTSYWS